MILRVFFSFLFFFKEKKPSDMVSLGCFFLINSIYNAFLKPTFYFCLHDYFLLFLCLLI